MRSELCECRGRIIHHNAPAHSALFLQLDLVRNFTTVFEHTPYSPELAPCDVSCSQIQIRAAGRNLGGVSTIKSEMTSLLKGLSETEFQGCLKKRNIGTSELCQMGSILKGTKLTYHKIFKIKFI